LIIRVGKSQRLHLSDSRIAIVALLIILALGMQTVVQNMCWQNDQMLWNWTARHAPNSRIVHIALGTLAENSGHLQESLSEYETALQINADTIDALNNEAFVYARMGDWKKAAKNFECIVGLTPNKALAHFNLSFAYAVQKNYSDATKEQRKAIELDTNGAHAEWGLRLSQL